jgi:hypothetical protein
VLKNSLVTNPLVLSDREIVAEIPVVTDWPLVRDLSVVIVVGVASVVDLLAPRVLSVERLDVEIAEEAGCDVEPLIRSDPSPEDDAIDVIFTVEYPVVLPS